MIYVPAEVMPCVRICSVTQQSSSYTAPLQAQSAIQFWLDHESSYKRLSQPALDLVASPASQAIHISHIPLICQTFRVVISRTILTYKNVKTKTKMSPKRKLKYLKLKTLVYKHDADLVICEISS